VNSANDAQSLQFEVATPQGAPPALPADSRGVVCTACHQSVALEYFDVNGQQVCASCRDVIAQQLESPRGSLPLVRAGMFGLGAALLGAVLYYAVIAITNFEIGLVAIAIGYMVGYAIRKGTGGLGGRRFQVMALVLTYWSVGLAYLPLAMSGAQDQEQTAPAEAGAPAQPAATEPAEEDVIVAGAVAVLFGLSLALPLLVIFGSLPSGLITAAIIGFGMQQAWRMTGVPPLAITGPYRIGPGEASAT
jgi:hypothetical protein